MRRHLPSTAALTAFESAARHQSFTKAADELSVTQSAVCRQIGALEDFLKVKLFRRGRRGVTLTEAGIAYSRKVAARLDEVERDTLDVMARGGQGGTLELGVVPTFATKWLLPRLRGFLERHPDITVNLTSRARPFLFDDTPFDAAIHAGEAVWPGTEGLFLMRERIVAVCSPALLANADRVDWRALPLLQMSTRPYAWRHWLASCGAEVDQDMAGPRFELFSMLAEAALQGLGAALVPRFLVEDELRRGALVQIGDHETDSGRSYYLIYPEHKAEDGVLACFRAWLDGAARDYRGG
ncbi:LysR family transcriptional regulator [Massilia oculi]|uniref:LysR family transcriptional regulator n=1 Tax=Massilia hydrophila TaxID=3044279 RepID=A0ABS7Y7P3_9BURK|nr:LysR substrate-binding domain-containing protein [Massilia oculi]MCA1855690.1 LysR family transcriptional regulator [Massilia oculi]